MEHYDALPPAVFFSWKSWLDISLSFLLVPEDSGCWNASEQQGEEGEYFMNPIAEFISPHDKDEPVEKEFHRYKKIHGKEYNDKEHFERKHIFRHNARWGKDPNKLVDASILL